MDSYLSWLDYSEDHRRRMLDFIDQFRERDTRDELGIGSIRDAFAERLFPGTSTIQTRARYFLFIPWIYLSLENDEVPSAEIAAKARRREIALIDALLEAKDRAGVIGKLAGKELQRLPSNIYWQGLGALGIRIFPGAQSQYHRSLDGFYIARNRHPINDDREPTDGPASGNWHARLPPPPESFPDQAAFRLLRREAEYLQERIVSQAPGTLFAYLAVRGRASDTADYPWEHPRLAHFPLPIRKTLDHARNFSLAIQGAALLYNLMLAEKTRRKELIDDYQRALKDWSAEMSAWRRELARWERREFWRMAISGDREISSAIRFIPSSTRRFVDDWLDLVLRRKGARKIGNNPAARRLIHRRERHLKGSQARLDNPRALRLWNEASGIGRLDFRWFQAQTILKDILKGLRRV